MIRRFTLTQRILALSLIAPLLTAVLLYAVIRWQEAGSLPQRPDLPLPTQLGALCQLIQTQPDLNVDLLLRATSTPEIHMELVQTASLKTEGYVHFWRAVSGQIGESIPELGDCGVRIESRLPGSELAWQALDFEVLDQPPPFRFVVSLPDGRSLIAIPSNSTVERVVRARATWILVPITLLLSALTAWALHRQLRPLQNLSDAVERFGATQDTTPVTEAGPWQLRRLIRRFNEMRVRLQQLLETRTRMLAAISHDLGTYLTRLRLRIEFLEDDQRQRAERDIAEMQALIKDSLALARMDLSPEPQQTIEVAAFTRELVEHLADIGSAVRLNHTETGHILAHRTALVRALNNLIDNARKYAGFAEVSVRCRDGYVEWRIEDRGPGIPADEHTLVLEPFYRRDTARNLNKPGSGLGLSIVADIATRHQGSVIVEDRPGGGLRVRLRLPTATTRSTARQQD